jgi:hypothetical protein
MADQHIVVLVRGTLHHAQQGVRQLKMMGVGTEGAAGVGTLFGLHGRLTVQTEEGEQSRDLTLTELDGRWILIIPEDAYTAFRADVPGAVVDGRVPAGDAFPLFNITKEAVDRVATLLTPKKGWRFWK